MRIKIKGILILLFMIFLTGCAHNYSAVSHSKFLGTFKNKTGYMIVDNTLIDETIFKRSYQVGNNKCTFFYFEFDNNKKAKDYAKRNYKNNKHLSYKEYDGYTLVESKLSDKYIKIIQVDNMVLIGQSEKFLDRFEVNNLLKELGY